MLGRKAFLFALGTLVLIGLGGNPLAQAQSAQGPLGSYSGNIHQLHILAQYITTVNGLRIQAEVIQTVTAVAVHSQGGQTFWVVEKDEVDPQHFYNDLHFPPPGTPIQFFFFVDRIDVVAFLKSGVSSPLFVFKMTDQYAVLEEQQGRKIPDLPIATDLAPSEPGLLVLPQGGSLTEVPTFVERPTEIAQVMPGAPLFFLTLSLKGEQNFHGTPFFVKESGQWRLAGIYVAPRPTPQSGWSAVAALPSLNQLTSR